MSLISHEIPKQLFKDHHLINDYPYLLAHLLLEKYETYDKEYADFYKKTVKEYDFSILDNSAFELGDSINMDDLYEAGELFKPSHIIIPDALHNIELTQERCIEYIAKYGKKSTPKFIAVLQGKDEKELISLYQFYSSLPQIDIVALPFDFYSKEQVFDFYKNSPDIIKEKVELTYKMQRVRLVNCLLQHYGITEGMTRKLPKKLHLLGCAIPTEFAHYTSQHLPSINSVDTSAPIIYGWNNNRFPKDSTSFSFDKPKEKLADNLGITLSEQQLQDIAYNVRQFKSYLLNG